MAITFPSGEQFFKWLSNRMVFWSGIVLAIIVSYLRIKHTARTAFMNYDEARQYYVQKGYTVQGSNVYLFTWFGENWWDPLHGEDALLGLLMMIALSAAVITLVVLAAIFMF